MEMAFYMVMAASLTTSAVLLPMAGALLVRGASTTTGISARLGRQSTVRAAMIFGADLYREEASTVQPAQVPVQGASRGFPIPVVSM